MQSKNDNKELTKEQAYDELLNFINTSLIKLDLSTSNLVKQQQDLTRRMYSSRISNDAAWCQKKLSDNFKESLICKGAIDVLAKMKLMTKGVVEDVNTESNDKEEQIK